MSSHALTTSRKAARNLLGKKTRTWNSTLSIKREREKNMYCFRRLKGFPGKLLAKLEAIRRWSDLRVWAILESLRHQRLLLVEKPRLSCSRPIELKGETPQTVVSVPSAVVVTFPVSSQEKQERERESIWRRNNSTSFHSVLGIWLKSSREQERRFLSHVIWRQNDAQRKTILYRNMFWLSVSNLWSIYFTSCPRHGMACILPQVCRLSSVSRWKLHLFHPREENLLQERLLEVSITLVTKNQEVRNFI